MRSIVRLIDDVPDAPDRYKMLATIMFLDMGNWKRDEKDLANIKRLMDNSERRLGQARAGKIRPLAVTTGKRSRELPDVPTLSEQGFKGFEISGWYGLVAPAGTPAAIIKRVNADVTKVLTSGEAPQVLRKAGYDPTPTSPEAFGRFMRAEIVRWSKAVKEYGIKAAD